MNGGDACSWWQTRWGLALLGFAVIAAFFLMIEHAAHVLGALPYLLLLACPVLHGLMHRRHHAGHPPDGSGHTTHRRPDEREEGGR